MPKLTKRIVEATTAGPTQAFTWDSEVKGFGLRITPAGAKSYVLSYRDPPPLGSAGSVHGGST